MLALTVGFDRKCDFVSFLRERNFEKIQGLCERTYKNMSGLEIYMETKDVSFLSEILTEYILVCIRGNMAKKHIDDYIPFLSDAEKEQIVSALPFEKYQKDINSKVYEYISQNGHIDIHGFLRFRIPEFERNVIADTNAVCKTYIDVREYEEMLSFLVNYVKNSRSFGKYNLVFKKCGAYEITDEAGNRVDGTEDVLETDTRIIGKLVSLLPESITVYNEKYADDTVLNVLKTVFKDRLS